MIKELDLVHEDDQHTHFVSLLEGDFNTEDRLSESLCQEELEENHSCACVCVLLCVFVCACDRCVPGRP